MATVFYDHLIDWKMLDEAIRSAGIDGQERLDVHAHAEHVLHIEVLRIFITHLPRELHEEFLIRFHSAPHDTAHLHFVVSHSTTDVETAVKEKTKLLIQEIIRDLN